MCLLRKKNKSQLKNNNQPCRAQELEKHHDKNSISIIRKQDSNKNNIINAKTIYFEKDNNNAVKNNSEKYIYNILLMLEFGNEIEAAIKIVENNLY